MKLTYDGREIESNAVDYGDGMVMIQYKDTRDVTIVPKRDIHKSNDLKEWVDGLTTEEVIEFVKWMATNRASALRASKRSFEENKK